MSIADENYSAQGNNFLPGDVDEADTIKILLSTDNHVGYNEKCKIRGNDSVEAFEEVLHHAQSHDVDMILLGGDLFHDNKPSRGMMHSVINLLRKYTMGEKPCQLEFLSDPSINFKHNKFPSVNYEDPNLNISYPVFSIHGNHDDPSSNNLCALDILSSCGLVNYFGKCNTVDKVEVTPLLLRKGQTKLALYGLGCIRDERLHRLFEQQKVTILKPREESASWFNLFTIHQNRAKHGAKDYIPESFLGDFLDFVLWGHEHDCRVDPEFNGHFWVSQPGSSVATSLSEGESKPKHCALLKVNKKNFSLQKIRLSSVRPFHFEDIVLATTDIKPDIMHEKKVSNYCKERVEALIELARKEHVRLNGGSRSALPLIRLRVDYSGGYETFNCVQFGQQFIDKVANPKDLVLFTRKRQAREKGDILHLDDVEACVSELSHKTIEEIVNVYLGATVSKGSLKLDVLNERGMSKAVGEFVKKDDKDAIDNMVDHQVKSANSSLNQNRIERATDIIDSIKKLKKDSDGKGAKELDSEFDRVLEESQRLKPLVPPAETINSDNEQLNTSLINSVPAPSKRGRGRGSRGGAGGSRGTSSRGRGGTRGSRARGSRGGKGRGSSKSDPVVELSSDDDVSVISATPSGASVSAANGKPPAKKFKGTLIDSDDDEDDYLPGRRSFR